MPVIVIRVLRFALMGGLIGGQAQLTLMLICTATSQTCCALTMRLCSTRNPSILSKDLMGQRQLKYTFQGIVMTAFKLLVGASFYGVQVVLHSIVSCTAVLLISCTLPTASKSIH